MGSVSLWHLAIILLVIAFFAFAAMPKLRSIAAGASAAEALSEVPVPRGNNDSQSKAEALRDALAQRLRSHCDERGIPFTSFVSTNGADSIWLRFEFVQHVPQTPLSLRSALLLEVQRHDFHRFENLLTLRLGRGTQHLVLNGLTELQDTDINQVLDFVVGTRGPFPRLRSRRIRQQPFQLWRPKNRVARIRRDWVSTGLWTVGLLGFLVAVSILFEALAEPDAAALPTLTAGGCLVAGIVLSRRRRVHVLNIGRPKTDPLALIRLDSWQSTVNHLGTRHAEVRSAILQRLTSSLPTGIAVQPETLGYASVDGKVEREQIVARFRRAMAFVHLEAYGDDLYVAWDSHVNAGIWVEQETARGIDRPTGKHVVANRVVSGWQRPNEYDLNDASFLTEWIHAGVTAVIRQQVAEHQIDQEIDFTVQRESRSSALQAQQATDGSKAARRFGLGALKRSA